MANEESPYEADITGFWRLRAAAQRIDGGIWHPSERPGLGIQWDDDAIAAHRI